MIRHLQAFGKILYEIIKAKWVNCASLKALLDQESFLEVEVTIFFN